MLSTSTIEEYIKSLHPFPIMEYGSREWIRQMVKVEKIYYMTQNQSEKISQLLCEHNKVIVLVHELISADLNFQNTLTITKRHLQVAKGMIIDKAMNTLTSLIGCAVNEPEHIPTDALIPFIDFCSKKIARLTEISLEDIDIYNRSDPKHMELQLCFSCLKSICSLSVAAASETIPLTAIKRLVSTCDVVPSLCTIITNQPWRMVKYGRVIKWSETSETNTVTLEPRESLRVCNTESFAWIALERLTQPSCTNLAEWNDARVASFQSVSELISEVLIDQIPVVSNLKQFVYMLRVSAPSPPKYVPVIEVIPEMYEEFSKVGDWNTVAKYQIEHHFTQDQREAMSEAGEVASIFELFMDL